MQKSNDLRTASSCGPLGLMKSDSAQRIDPTVGAIAMSHPLADAFCKFSLVVALSGVIEAGVNTASAVRPSSIGTQDSRHSAPLPTKTGQGTFVGVKGGDEREIGGVKLCWCPPGRFTMGSPPGEVERRPGEEQVEVTMTKGFWVGKFEVTQGQWQHVVGKFPGKHTVGEGDDFPVYNINFAEAEEFCRKLTEKAHASGELPNEWQLRLPTEAQWEYACRAGTTTATSFGDRLSSKQANFQGTPYNGAEAGPSLKRAAPIGSYPANAWGIHDMHGNVYEWCRDWSHAELPGGVDPDFYAARSTATLNRDGTVSRIRRGGCWADNGWPCRSSFRARFEPERRSDHIGFRIVAVWP